MMGFSAICAVLLLTFGSSIEETDVRFYLFTRHNLNNYIEIGPNNASKYIDRSAKVTFLVHGWGSSRKVKWMQQLKDAQLLHTDKNNVIQVDYSKIARKFYPIAAEATVKVGIEVGNFIINLVNGGVPLEQVYYIGHSLGAHVGGYASRYIFNKTSRKLPRITGLDPAGPLFEWPIKLDGLNKDDAEVVYAIHTDAGIFGIVGTVGTTDIFVNGGTPLQPGCPDLLHNIIFCSHDRSIVYYIYAVAHPNTLLASKCGSYGDFLLGECIHTKQIDIGGNITRDDAGKYYLRTRANLPN